MADDHTTAHAALAFIRSRGLIEDFYRSGALTGACCDEVCRHAPEMMRQP